MNNKATAKDFFLHLGAIAAFYASAIALTTLLFEVINYAYPKITNAYQYYAPSISFQVATLIVAFPLFLFLSWLLQKSYAAEPELRETLVRRWLAYITIFVAGAVAAGDLVTLIYYFLDGQELTTAFVLKVAALFLVAGGIFLYYFREIRNRIAPKERNAWRVAAGAAVLASIVVGFAVVGSPADQRAKRLDATRLNDLQTLQWQVVSFYQQKGSIPSSLAELEDPISGFRVPRDPKTGAPYEYKLIGQSAKAFELCAVFEREGGAMMGGYPRPMMSRNGDASMMVEPAVKQGDSWQHGMGRACFSRAIDPQLYPVRTR